MLREMRTLIAASLLLSFSVLSLADGLDDAIKSRMTRDHIPGLAFAVVRRGQIVRQGAYGYGDVEWNAKATNDTKFEVASLSKMIAGAAARMLIEDGKLNPEDPVSKYIDGLPESWNGMKVRHLYTMSSGLPEDFGGPQVPYDQDVVFPNDDASAIKEFTRLTMVAPVGERFSYSSPNIHMLGMIISKVSGMPYAEFVQNRVFGPAGMTDSSIIDNAAVITHRAQGYRREKDVLKRGRYLGQYLHSRADDAVLSTPRDYAKFIIALQEGKLVKDLNALWQPTVSDTGVPLDYSYGWFIDTLLGHRRFEHSGGYRTGFHTFVARYPDDDLSVIVFTNCDFSPVRDYVNVITRKYMRDLPDPEVESSKHDENPAATQELVLVAKDLSQGKLDQNRMEATAAEPAGLQEMKDFFQQAGEFTFAGRAKLDKQLTMHGFVLTDYETLKTVIDGQPQFVTFYRNDTGKVAYVELTN